MYVLRCTRREGGSTCAFVCLHRTIKAQYGSIDLVVVLPLCVLCVGMHVVFVVIIGVFLIIGVFVVLLLCVLCVGMHVVFVVIIGVFSRCC